MNWGELKRIAVKIPDETEVMFWDGGMGCFVPVTTAALGLDNDMLWS